MVAANVSASIKPASAAWNVRARSTLLADICSCMVVLRMIAMPGKVMANKSSKTAAVITGPEGGFEKYEADLARTVGLHICSMGERILRCETAPIVALTAVMYATGNLS